MLLSDKVAIITGASKGIGLAIAIELAVQGAIVIGTTRSLLGVIRIKKKFKENGIKNGKGVILNLNNKKDIDNLIKNTIKEFGSINILVNNAGIKRDKLTIKMSEKDWDIVIETNLKSVFLLSRAVLKPMIKVNNGRIINITSLIGSCGNIGQANYAASKSGIIGITKSLAKEIARYSITVNCISPGYIKTDMTKNISCHIIKDKVPLRRMGNPEDIAYAVAFLASNKANYITGTTIHINGGIL